MALSGRALRHQPAARAKSFCQSLDYFGLPLAALAIVLAPAMMGQHFFTKGSLAKAEGRNMDAIAAFRRADALGYMACTGY